MRTSLRLKPIGFAVAFGLLVAAPLGAQSTPPECATTGIAGVLRVSSTNPRYFTNDCGKAIYLTGAHTWNNFPDMDDAYPPENQPFNFSQYLDFLDQYNHNFIRLWAWEGPFPNDGAKYARRVWAGPQPWLRTGPGNDNTGHLKFNLTQWNQAYFDRLRTRVSQAQARGKYVSIMLFEGWELHSAPGANSHPFNSINNINGISYGAAITNIHTLAVPAITAIQEEYVRRVVDAVNDLDNVLYEIANEPGSYSTSWQYHMITFVRQYEAGKPKQHPVGMTFQYPGGANSTLFNSAADWISPGSESSYDSNPPANTGAKVILNDTDHLGGSAVGDRPWVWKSFTRGLNVLFMDRYDLPYSITNGPIANAVAIRTAMGNTLTFSRRMDLLHTTPSTSIASTGYCLVSPSECLVYNPAGGSFTVNLQAFSGPLEVEWFNPANQQTTVAANITGGSTRSFTPPFSGEAVLFLQRPGVLDTTGPEPGSRGFTLYAPSPNPTSTAASIRYELPIAAHVRIEIYDLMGRRLAELVNRTLAAGPGEVTWDGTDGTGHRVSNGMVVVRMTTGTIALSRKLIMIR